MVCRKSLLPWLLLAASLVGPPLAVCLFSLLTQHQLRQTIANGAVVVSTLERFHAARSNYPEALDELVPGLIAEIPPASWGRGLWIYQRRDQNFILQVNETKGTGDGNSHWLQYDSVSQRWDTGD